MSRKDYVLIAEALRQSHYIDTRDDRANTVIDSLAVRLANALAADNPRFDRERFIKAAR